MTSAATVMLHSLPPMDEAPSLSPFCMKVETYLRMAKIPYSKAIEVDTRGAPKGKLPWIEHDGRRLGDSTYILEQLRTSFDVRLDDGLSADDRAKALAFTRMLEEHFYWALVHARWFDARHWPRMEAVFLGKLPRAGRAVVGAIAKGVMRRAMKAHGIGRHSHDEVMARGREDLTALSVALGDRPFFLGDEPRSVDAVVHAFLANVIDVKMDTELQRHALGLPNLVAYTRRMSDRYYADA